MSYSISISGHGADGETVEQVTKDAVRALRAPKGDVTGPTAGATASGTGPDGTSFSYSIRSDEDLEAEAES